MAEVVLQKVAHEVNYLFDLHGSQKSVVDVSIDFHSKINSKLDIKTSNFSRGRADFSVDKK